MPRRSADQPKSAGQVNLYWRRRVIALIAGLGMLALVAWTVNGALGGGGAKQVTDLSQTASQHPSAPASGSAPATPAAGSASRTATGRAQPVLVRDAGHAPEARGGRDGGTRRGTRPGGAAGRQLPPPAPARPPTSSSACSRPGTATRRTPGRNSASTWCPPLPAAAPPTSARRSCASSIRAGKNQVWDSAGCARPAAQATTLARGVPAAVQITWNGRTSLPGCQAGAPGRPARHLLRHRLRREAQQPHPHLRAERPQALTAAGSLTYCMP